MNGGNNAATVTITDSAGQTWTQTASGYASSASSNRSAMFYKANSAAVTSVTATWTAAGNNVGAVVFEVRGADASSPADGSVNSNLSGSAITSLTSGSLTTANANDILIYAARSQNDETTWTAGNGYTIPTNGNNTRQGMQYEIVSSIQSGVTTSVSWNNGTAGAAGIFAAFKAASGGVAGPTVTATAGTPQSAVINQPFATQLQDGDLHGSGERGQRHVCWRREHGNHERPRSGNISHLCGQQHCRRTLYGDRDGSGGGQPGELLADKPS